MFMVHVERSGAVLPFSLEVSTQSPLPNSCLEYGGLQCSHIFIIHCVFYCFHSWFISCPGALYFVIYFHLFSFILIYVNFFSFFIFLHILLFSLEKPLPIKTTCMSTHDSVLLINFPYLKEVSQNCRVFDVVKFKS